MSTPPTSARRPDPEGRPVRESPPAAGERDPSIDALRIQAVLSAEHAIRAGQLTATALLETRAGAGTTDDPPAAAEGTESDDELPLDDTPAIIRILRGDHRAVLRTAEVLAGGDGAMRLPWQTAIIGLAQAIVGRAIERGILDFPVGNPFWDTFTTAQCRDIAGALSATGFRFDAIDAWADERVPTYRELTAAVADAGIEPRRIRAWPTQHEIGRLYAAVTVAADEFIATEAAEMDLIAVQDLIGGRHEELDFLWRNWAKAGPVLAAAVPEGVGVGVSVETTDAESPSQGFVST